MLGFSLAFGSGKSANTRPGAKLKSNRQMATSRNCFITVLLPSTRADTMQAFPADASRYRPLRPKIPAGASRRRLFLADFRLHFMQKRQIHQPIQWNFSGDAGFLLEFFEDHFQHRLLDVTVRVDDLFENSVGVRCDFRLEGETPLEITQRPQPNRATQCGGGDVEGV